MALPTFLPPESYLYYVLYQLVYSEEYSSFWNELERIPEARLYTKSKLINNIFSKFNITENFSNDSLKNKEVIDELKFFFKRSRALSYYYSQDKNKDELHTFLNKCKGVFTLVKSKMKAAL